MSLAATRPPHTEPRDVWIGLDPAAHADRRVVLIVDTDTATRAVEEAETTLATEARRSALLASAGLLAGFVGTWLIDLVTAGPGLRIMVGL